MSSEARQPDARADADDLDGALAGLLEMAVEIVGAAYGAIGILDDARLRLEHFVTAGLHGATDQEIGAHPRGRGVLGLLIADPRPLRIDDVADDPRSYGFPPGHPVMHGFLGAPVLLGGEPCGNLYFAEKRSGAFGEPDERTAIALASLAADIVENARSAEPRVLIRRSASLPPRPAGARRDGR